MLKRLECNSFYEDYKCIDFHKGVNSILGGTATGKSFLLWIIDYSLGGNQWNCIYQLNKDYIEDSELKITFEFDGSFYYFTRSMSDPDKIAECDDSFEIKRELTCSEYEAILEGLYKLSDRQLSLGDLRIRLNRIYGAPFFDEHIPYLCKYGESVDSAIDFLLRLSGNGIVLDELEKIRRDLNMKRKIINPLELKFFDDSQLSRLNEELDKYIKEKSKITIEEESKNYEKWGFDTETNQKINLLRNNIRLLTRERNNLHSQLVSIRTVDKINDRGLSLDFEELHKFFPALDMKPLQAVKDFHIKLRRLISENAIETANELKERISKLDEDIDKCRTLIDESKVMKTISESTIDRCVNIASIIKDLETKLKGLEANRTKIKDTNKIIEYANIQLSIKDASIIDIADFINNELREICVRYGYDALNSPKFEIRKTDLGYYMSYRTPGNSSESAEFRGVTLYDLVLSKCYKTPFMIHDSSILGRLDKDTLRLALNEYKTSNSQIFIAFDNCDINDELIGEALNQSKALKIDSEKGLFGRIWSNS